LVSGQEAQGITIVCPQNAADVDGAPETTFGRGDE
jgi:hypothetical protein